jgi:hypothetical protein
MKIFKLSDDDFKTLVEVLETAIEDSKACASEWGYETYQDENAQYLLHLLKPMTEPEIMAELNQERISMIAEATWLLTKAGIDVPITRDGETIHTFKAQPWPSKFEFGEP